MEFVKNSPVEGICTLLAIFLEIGVALVMVVRHFLLADNPCSRMSLPISMAPPRKLQPFKGSFYSTYGANAGGTRQERPRLPGSPDVPDPMLLSEKQHGMKSRTQGSMNR